MNLNLRQAIYQKLAEKNADDLLDTINDAVGNDERTLPGLGVLFEVIWQHSDKDIQNQLVTTLREHLPH